MKPICSRLLFKRKPNASMEPSTKTNTCNKKNVQPKKSIFKHVSVALSEYFLKKIVQYLIYPRGFINVCV